MTYSQLSKKTDVFYFIFRGLLQNVRKEKTHFNSEGVNCHTLNFPLFLCQKIKSSFKKYWFKTVSNCYCYFINKAKQSLFNFHTKQSEKET